MSSAAGAFDETIRLSGGEPRIAVRRFRITNADLVAAGSAILLLPNLLFALHLETLPAAFMLIGSLGFAALQLRRQLSVGSVLAQPLHLPRLGLCLALAAMLLVLGGEGHLVFANWDWLWRDAVLADLARAPFPPTYEVAGDSFFLRAPLGMYMLPALVAKATTLGAGHAALLAQNVSLLTLVLYLLAALAGRSAALVIAVFVSFSGLDVLGQVIVWLVKGHDLRSFVLASHIENWTRFQYSSVVTQLFWVPNHALPSYWLALIALFGAKRELALGDLVLAMAAALFWSPFAFIGAMPFAAFLFLRDVRLTVTSVRVWLSSLVALSFLPAAFYMHVDAAQVPHEFVHFGPPTIFLIALFLIVEIPHVFFVAAVRARLEPWLKGVLAVAICVLIALPTVRVGYANDLMMRASIPALTILAFGFAQALTDAWRTRIVLFVAGVCVCIVGSVTPAQEIIRSQTFPAYAVSDCGLVTVWEKIGNNEPTLINYLARSSALPSWLTKPAQEPRPTIRADSPCWPDLVYVPFESLLKLPAGTILRDHERSDQKRM